MPLSVMNLTIDDIAPGSGRFTVGSEIFSPDRFGVFLCLSGNVKLSGCDSSLELHRGSLYIYTVASYVRVLDMSADAAGIMIYMNAENLLDAIRSVLDIPAMLHIRRHPAVKLQPEVMDYFMKRISNIRTVMESAGSSDRERDAFLSSIDEQILSAQCNELIFLIIREYFTVHKAAIAGESNARPERVYSEFMRLLHSNFRKERSVGFYAAQTGLSTGHFTTLIKEISGLTPTALIDHVVTSEAKHLLSGGHLSVKEVTATLGFPSQSFFGKYFKRNTGMSPAAYRSSHLLLKNSGES